MRRDELMVDGIDVPSRLRAVDPKKVSALAESIDVIGLQTPITVWDDDGAPTLVAGAHRLQAVKKLGWEWIDVVFTSADEIDRQLWEIDENLIRSELTPTQEAEHLAKRKELWGARRVSGQIVPKPQGGRPQGFAGETADATGVSRKQVNRAVARAEKVTEEVRDEIRGTDLDKGVVLDELAKTPPEEQKAKLVQFQSQREQEVDPDEKQLAAMQSAWNRSSSEARRRFMDWVDW